MKPTPSRAKLSFLRLQSDIAIPTPRSALKMTTHVLCFVGYKWSQIKRNHPVRKCLVLDAQSRCTGSTESAFVCRSYVYVNAVQSRFGRDDMWACRTRCNSAGVLNSPGWPLHTPLAGRSGTCMRAPIFIFLSTTIANCRVSCVLETDSAKQCTRQELSHHCFEHDGCDRPRIALLLRCVYRPPKSTPARIRHGSVMTNF